MMKYIERRLFPEGKPINSTMALTGKDYRLAGEIMAMSVIEGGQAPHFISAQIFKYLCGDRSVNNMNSIVHKELCEKVSIYACQDKVL